MKFQQDDGLWNIENQRIIANVDIIFYIVRDRVVSNLENIQCNSLVSNYPAQEYQISHIGRFDLVYSESLIVYNINWYTKVITLCLQIYNLTYD